MAALQCFNELGYSETTMALIRERAEASTGSIYHHFENKEHLAAALYLEGIRDYQEGYLAELERRKSAKAGIFAIIRYHLAWVAGNPEWARYLNRMRHAEFMAQSSQALHEANREFMTRIGSWFRPHIKTGRIRKLPKAMYAALLMGPLQEFTRMWLAGRADLSIEDARTYLAEATWLSLKK